VLPSSIATVEGLDVKRLALLAMLLASSPLVAAPAPLPKPQRKAGRPAVQHSVTYFNDFDRWVVNAQQLGAAQWAPLFPPAMPAQRKNADPPG
jgi:hypothetical protein